MWKPSARASPSASSSYNRGACRLSPASLQVLADRCPNLIGFKDGLGDIEKFVAIPPDAGRALRLPGPACRRQKSLLAPTRRWAARSIPRRSSTSSRRRRCLLPGPCQRRHRRLRAPDPRLLPALYRAAQQGRGLCRLDREGRRDAGRPRRRAGAAAAVGTAAGRDRPARSPDRQAGASIGLFPRGAGARIGAAGVPPRASRVTLQSSFSGRLR